MDVTPDPSASASTVVPGVDDNPLLAPRWMSPHDTHVYWPADWTDNEKLYWLAKEFHLVDVQPSPAAAMYAGPTSTVDGFSWSSYNPEDHVLVHQATFYEFLDTFRQVDALTKGMKTVNRKRRKQNQLQRRIERRLAAARSSREGLRAETENQELAKKLLLDRLTAQRAATEAWRRGYNETVDLVRNLRTELEVMRGELAALQTTANETQAEQESFSIEEQTAAAQLRTELDKKLGRTTPEYEPNS